MIRNLKSNERLHETDKKHDSSTIIQIYNSQESTPVRMRRRSDSSQRRQSAPKLWARTNFQSSGDMDRHLIGDPSLSSLDVIDLKPKIRDHTAACSATTTGYINDLCSPVSDSVTNFRDNHLYYHQHLRTNNLQNSNLDTIVLSPGAVLKSTSTPGGIQRSFTHDFATTKTILIPFPHKISDEFMYSLEHVL